VSDYIKVDPNNLDQLASDITSQAGKLESTLENLKQRVAPAIAQWDGSSGSEYNNTQNKWNTAAEDLREVLAAIGIAVRDAAEAFRRGEQQNTARWTN
jgi:early secretory antigenic target protein ESAT-6